MWQEKTALKVQRYENKYSGGICSVRSVRSKRRREDQSGFSNAYTTYDERA
jgi:hypothetical protein